MRWFENENRVWTREEVEARVIRIVKASNKCKNPDALTPDAKFRELGFDSLDVVDLVTALEDNFGVHLKNSEVEQIKTIREAITLFQTYKIPPIVTSKESATAAEPKIVPGTPTAAGENEKK
jgi:acyl carrier protein